MRLVTCILDPNLISLYSLAGYWSHNYVPLRFLVYFVPFTSSEAVLKIDWKWFCRRVALTEIDIIIRLPAIMGVSITILVYLLLFASYAVLKLDRKQFWLLGGAAHKFNIVILQADHALLSFGGLCMFSLS
jgi:hypothetical protein